MEKLKLFLNKIFSDVRLTGEIISKSKFIPLDAGENILEEAQYIRNIPLVYRGRVRVMRQDDSGRKVLLYYIEPGESCALSLAAGLNHQKSVAYAETDLDTELFAIPIDVLEDLMGQFPTMNEFILKLFHSRFNELIQFIDSVVFKTMDFRLIELLKKKQRKTNTNLLKVTHQQLANELGTAREVISRLLKQLENEKKVINHRGEIELIAPL